MVGGGLTDECAGGRHGGRGGYGSTGGVAGFPPGVVGRRVSSVLNTSEVGRKSLFRTTGLFAMPPNPVSTAGQPFICPTFSLPRQHCPFPANLGPLWGPSSYRWPTEGTHLARPSFLSEWYGFVGFPQGSGDTILVAGQRSTRRARPPGPANAPPLQPARRKPLLRNRRRLTLSS